MGRDHRDLLAKFDRFLQPEKSFGLELCKLGLIDAIWGSQIEKRLYSLRYHQEGRLRLYAETYRGNLHGEFFLFYPDGNLWMRGAYRNNELVSDAMRIFMPDGTHLQPKPAPDNVIPFRRAHEAPREKQE